MKKNIIILSLCILFFSFIIYQNIGREVAFEVITIEEAPTFIQQAIKGKGKFGFSLFQDENDTYIYFKSDTTKSEYITTEIEVKDKRGNYVIVAKVNKAVNIPSTEKLIKLNKITEENVVLKVIDRS